MTVRELIKELQDWLNRNAEPDIPGYEVDADVRVSDENGTYDSPILLVEDANGPFLIVEYPHEDCDAEAEGA